MPATRRNRKMTQKGEDLHKAMVAHRAAVKTRRNRQAVRGELQALPPPRRSRSRSSSQKSHSSMSALASKMRKMKLGSH